MRTVGSWKEISTLECDGIKETIWAMELHQVGVLVKIVSQDQDGTLVNTEFVAGARIEQNAQEGMVVRRAIIKL